MDDAVTRSISNVVHAAARSPQSHSSQAGPTCAGSLAGRASANPTSLTRMVTPGFTAVTMLSTQLPSYEVVYQRYHRAGDEAVDEADEAAGDETRRSQVEHTCVDVR